MNLNFKALKIKRTEKKKEGEREEEKKKRNNERKFKPPLWALERSES